MHQAKRIESITTDTKFLSLSRNYAKTLNARNYISAPKIWPNHNLNFELKRQCYSLRLHTEEIWEKWVKKNHWFMLKIWLNVYLFWRKFRRPEKHKLRPWWQHTVTLVIRACVAWAGWFGQQKKIRRLNIYQCVATNQKHRNSREHNSKFYAVTALRSYMR